MPTILRPIFALIVIAALIPTKPLVAQRSDAEWLDDCRYERERGWNDRRETFCEVRETRVRAPGGTVSMEGLRNGGVYVTGWDRSEMLVRTRVRAQARSESRARQIASQVRTVISGSTITAEGPRDNDDDESWSASFVVSLPHRSNIRVDTRNGPVSVENLRGNMSLETRNGPLSLRDLGGSVRARTTNGPLTITLSGSRWEGDGLEARTSNGPLSISIPDGYSARLEAGTSNGPMSLGFPVTVSGRINKNISTTLGSGGALIRAETTNGPLTIRRR
ncbi:MAG TPA: DUF4097 family beta strand repeat-containing protein [Gemmatimonadaceae bacterium]|nr:DUF4097 family beta strand repeat-containing protein [Gemmatimonadaceae bacterium]